MHRLLVALGLLVMGCAKATSGVGDLAEPSPPDLSAPRGGFWQKCVFDLDCESGVCYRAMTQDATGHCTMPCTRQCPDHFECKTVRIDNSNEADLCVPAQDTMCNRCST